MSDKNEILVENVTLVKEGKTILNDVSWNVKKGEHWVILGLNGSGKTSLLNVITGYLWATKGKVEVLGGLFGKTNIQELRKSIGWVSSSLDERFQTRFPDTALEVVLSGKYSSIGLHENVTDDDIRRGMELLDQFDIQHLSEQLYRTLSQGQKRRVMLSRALMADPELLILDEPCNGLDIYSREQLLASLQKMSQQENGPTLIYVTHHIEEIVPSLSHVLLVNGGKVVAAGEKKEVLTNELLEKTFNLPVNVHWENERAWVSINQVIHS